MPPLGRRATCGLGPTYLLVPVPLPVALRPATGSSFVATFTARSTMLQSGHHIQVGGTRRALHGGCGTAAACRHGVVWSEDSVCTLGVQRHCSRVPLARRVLATGACSCGPGIARAFVQVLHVDVQWPLPYVHACMQILAMTSHLASPGISATYRTVARYLRWSMLGIKGNIPLLDQ